MLDSDARLSVAPPSLRARLAAPDVRHVLLLMFLAAVVLCGQIQNEVLYSVDGIVYALVGKELTLKPFSQWVILTWNGSPFYEHPHLTPWLLGASMKLFGVSTLTAILPIVLISLATVLLAYLLGRALLDHRLGLLAGTVLTLTPEFVRGGRNPMLEPALMFFIMLARVPPYRRRPGPEGSSATDPVGTQSRAGLPREGPAGSPGPRGHRRLPGRGPRVSGRV